jgi:hypothetical protein
MSASRALGPLSQPFSSGGLRAPEQPGPVCWTFARAEPTGRNRGLEESTVDWIDLWQTDPGKTPRDRAKWLVSYFAAKGGARVFPHIDRRELGASLVDRIDNPGLIQQGAAPLCGPASLVFDLITRDPMGYAQFAIDLYECGRARIGRLDVEPGADLKAYAPPLGRQGIDPADWITLASIRDSENWFLDYDEVGDALAGLTTPHELADWFSKAGYTSVRNEANIFFNKGEDNARQANHLFQNGYRVCLFINGNMLNATKQNDKSLTPDHWVVLVSPLAFEGSTIRFDIFTWGDGRRRVPAPGFVLSIAGFLNNYYGYVAAKY